MNKALLDINKLTPYAVGFDKIFNDMHRYMEHASASTGYPPYNILKEGNSFKIEIALAGVNKKDLSIEVSDGVLTIMHDPAEIDNAQETWLHRGIAQRKFKRHFTLADDVVVEDAEMVNGMLQIYLQRIIPEEKKPRTIKIK
jgi:molecular chaperone IbpA